MYVIFPADELLLMTYGVAIPRFKPRPTLDCLPEPKVPLALPSPPQKSTKATDTKSKKGKKGRSRKISASSFDAEASANAADPQVILPTPTSVFTYDFPETQFQFQYAPTTPSITNYNNYNSQSLPPTPTRRNSRSSLLQNGGYSNGATAKRSSVRSTRSGQPTPPPSVRVLEPSPVRYAQPYTPPMSSQHNELTNMRATAREVTPLRTSESLYPTDVGYDPSAYDPNAGALGFTRERSPSVFLEPPTPDPTSANWGHGWGRPMSPMDLPPEPVRSPASSSKTSRLRPKLHIPLGRLGRDKSDQRESNRLREDVHLHVENPIFNSENLRQRNFDAFFESAEPVYKLQPKTPASAPPGSSSSSSPILGDYAGVYERPRGRGAANAKDALFARSPREEKALSARSKSADQYDIPPEERVGSTSVGGGSTGNGGSGAPQKGDSGSRFLGKIFKWTKKT